MNHAIPPNVARILVINDQGTVLVSSDGVQQLDVFSVMSDQFSTGILIKAMRSSKVGFH